MSSPTYSEKSQTEWYYSIRGDASRRGRVSEIVLSRMATEGNLRPDDLVWNKDTGDAWIRADSIPGLFPQRTPDPEPASRAEAPLDHIPISRRHRSSLPILLVVGVLLVYPTSWFCQRLHTGEATLPPPIARWLGLEIVNSSSLDAKLRGALIDLHIRNGNMEKARSLIIEMSRLDSQREMAGFYKEKLKEAQIEIERQAALDHSVPLATRHLDDERPELADPLIAQLKKSPRHADIARELARKAAGLRVEQSRRKALEDQLRQGRQTAGSLRELIEFFERKQKPGDLVNLAEGILQNRSPLPSRACLGVAQLYSLLNKPAHVAIALEQFAARITPSSPSSELLEARELYQSIQQPLKLAALIEKHLESHPAASDLCFELAAIRAEAGDSKAALAHLKNALKDENAKDQNVRLQEQAATDKRFDSIRDTWAFRRLIKKD